MGAQRDSRTTVLLTRATVSDSRAMKQIAIMTTIFLPATFVSSLFSTVFFDIPDPGSAQGDRLAASSRFWVYWAVTVPLSIVVYAVLVGMYRFERRTRGGAGGAGLGATAEGDQVRRRSLMDLASCEEKADGS